MKPADDHQYTTCVTGMFKTIMVIIAVFIFSACESRHYFFQYYEGKPLPKANVAIIRGYDNYRTNQLINSMWRIKAVNGNPLPVSTGVLQTLKADKHEVVMIGDDLTKDILGAVQFGLPAVWYNPEHLKVPQGITAVDSLFAVTHFRIGL